MLLSSSAWISCFLMTLHGVSNHIPNPANAKLGDRKRRLAVYRLTNCTGVVRRTKKNDLLVVMIPLEGSPWCYGKPAEHCAAETRKEK